MGVQVTKIDILEILSSYFLNHSSQETLESKIGKQNKKPCSQFQLPEGPLAQSSAILSKPPSPPPLLPSGKLLISASLVSVPSGGLHPEDHPGGPEGWRLAAEMYI